MRRIQRRTWRWMALALWFAGTASLWATQMTLVADAHVNSALPDANSGRISNLNVGAGYTTLVQFDLSMLPAGTTAAQVTRAILLLYCNRMNAAGSISVQAVSGAWDEASVTYTTLPAITGSAQTVAVSQEGVYIAVDVTAQAQAWLTAPASNHGLALTTGAASVQFDSKENDQTGHAPTLDITLVNSGPAGPQGLMGLTGLTGPAGPQGAKGDTGATGVPGAIGLPGPIGPTGAAGPPGTMGPVGSQGLPGPTGAIGPQGAVGLQGTQGPVGAQGPVGMNFQGPYSSAIKYGAGDGVLYGGAGYVSLVANNQGNVPDLSPGLWTEFASGGAGPAGPAGQVGPTGLQGPIGPAGLTGAVGPAGPSGPSGAAATVSIGSVTMGTAGSQALVTNSGTASAAVLNFTVPRGDAGLNGTGGGTANSALPLSMYHAVSFSFTYYSLSGTTSNANETPEELTWIPNGCTATTLSVYSRQSNPILVKLRQGMPGAMADAGMSCNVAATGSCSATGNIPIAAGSFVDLSITGADGTPSAVWTALGCS